MNRFHVHLNVADLGASIRFYSQLFAAPPVVVRHDYAKWMLDDPRINFAISSRERAAGIDHVGLQVDTAEELAAIGQRLAAAGGAVVAEDDATCCYARSDKRWTEDPHGTRWEVFHTFGEATTYHAADAACSTAGPSGAQEANVRATHARSGASCCAPTSACG